MMPTRYTPEIAAEVLHAVSNGASLRQACRDKAIPESTVREWIRDDRDGLAARYQLARMLQLECWADQLIDISTDPNLEPQDKRVRVDTVKWLLSKLVPRRYGDRLLVAGDPESPVQLLHAKTSLDGLSLQQLNALEAFATAMIDAQSPKAA